MDELSDDQITALIADPATIETHEIAVQVMDCIDAEIANIQAQIDAFAAEFNGRPAPQDRLDWLKRATYASAMRKAERHKVYMRDKEIRHFIRQPARAAQATADRKAANIVKQERLKIEAETRRLEKQTRADAARAHVLALENEAKALKLNAFKTKIVAEIDAMYGCDYHISTREHIRALILGGPARSRPHTQGETAVYTGGGA